MDHRKATDNSLEKKNRGGGLQECALGDSTKIQKEKCELAKQHGVVWSKVLFLNNQIRVVSLPEVTRNRFLRKPLVRLYGEAPDGFNWPFFSEGIMNAESFSVYYQHPAAITVQSWAQVLDSENQGKEQKWGDLDTAWMLEMALWARGSYLALHEPGHSDLHWVLWDSQRDECEPLPHPVTVSGQAGNLQIAEKRSTAILDCIVQIPEVTVHSWKEFRQAEQEKFDKGV
ncbi:hypothetical protein HGM15179_014296 [Zosterops borbonicus]|uniref:Uncharacterized protein n=1 Tax=Zosterops borbonicus TaxID=364589 RepID=A0A8K1G7D8_9PASS|nr:hypothetical protein HGM15179_014296 [Zosterops borbonicus]